MSSDAPNADTAAPSIVKPVVRYESYSNEDQIAVIQDLIREDLSEPYTIFTFRHFVHEFPDLCIFAYVDQEAIGVVVCRLDKRANGLTRGYIGMLAVKQAFRHLGIATQLVQQAVCRMQEQSASEIVLETEVDNKAALAFYSRLNFMRYKRLHAFYLNRQDAFRLLLPLPRQGQEESDESIPIPLAAPVNNSENSTPFASSHGTSPAESQADHWLYS